MDVFTIALLFAAGSVAGWILEVIARLFTQEKRLVNPGFLSGPYLPIYGFGLLLLYFISWVELGIVPKIILLLVAPTVLELLTGLAVLYYYNVRLWDYSDDYLNFKGIICPLYSAIWAVQALAFYLFVFPFLPKMTEAILSYENSVFVLGCFYGIMFLDWARSLITAQNIRRFFVEMKQRHLETIKLNYDMFRDRMTALMKKRREENFLSRYLLSFRALDRKELMRQLRVFVVKKHFEFRKSMKQRKKSLKTQLIRSSAELLKRR